ncbi:MAG: c-type cytochrome [Anaerolineae bacterium]
MKMRSWLLGIVALVLLTMAACGGGGGAPAEKAAPAGDPEAGKEIYLGVGGCGACHTIEGLEGAIGQVGPDHTHIATNATELAKKAGVADAEAFIRQSILEPNAYIAEECPPGPCVAGVMPQTLKDTLTEQQVNDLVAFLMQQK